ncbi:MAG: tRNA pseudouridine32 synthase/23S rRNA pseudouridine746 synthase [Lentisphaeria bacterium]|jgi:tRNA pseudouridine32 synthase/23S rRNA pseudouridine746 synthase
MTQNNLKDDFIAPLCKEDIKILYEDNAILLLEKPTKLLSLSGRNPLNRDSVHWRLVQSHPTARLIHRLDFGTSGLMLVALNKEVSAVLNRQFSERKVSKTYTAILAGHLECLSGEISIPLAKDAENFPFQKVCGRSGKMAVSAYETIEQYDDPCTSRVIFRPLTGRTHQLRIHSREIGHPILGCDLYGNASSGAMASRLMLHACSLEFTHPLKNTPFKLDSCVPF